jgi:hypothetical protein
MGELRRDANFAEESLRAFGRGFLMRKHLDRHYPIMPGITRLVHFPHPARAEQ